MKLVVYKTEISQTILSPQFLLHICHHDMILEQHPNMKLSENLQGTCGEDKCLPCTFPPCSNVKASPS